MELNGKITVQNYKLEKTNCKQTLFYDRLAHTVYLVVEAYGE